MPEFLSHLFIPQESNNHRPKVLHNIFIFYLVIILFFSQFILTGLKTNLPSVLGNSVDVSTQELLLLTNQKRQEQNLAPLSLNEDLTLAASLKANDMFEKDYWAHNGPDGVTPWNFIKRAGYLYVYAGENLARGFSTSANIVDAWMASPSHKANVLSPKYHEVGFAIKKGKLLGEETTLVVEMFGSKGEPTPLARAENLQIKEANLVSVPVSESKAKQAPAIANRSQRVLVAPASASSLKAYPLINSRSFAWNFSIAILLLFISVLIIDMIIIERKKIVRLVGHNLDHILFFIAILIIAIISNRGLIL